MEHVPTLKEELDRKTIDVLTELVHRAETFRLDPYTLGVAVQAIYNVTNGIVADSVSELCTAAIGKGVKSLSKHFVGKGAVITCKWLPDKAGYAVGKRDAQTGFAVGGSLVKAEIPGREEQLTDFFAKLKSAGYVELS